jgi:hypothetical protein
MNLTPKHNTEEFNKFLFQRIDLNLYRHKYLKDYINKVFNRQLQLYDSSVINTLNDGWIIILHGEMLLIYGDNWQRDQLKEIQEVFDLNKYTNFTLAGDNELIDEIINFYNPKNFKVDKRRLFYKATVIRNYENNELKIRLGNQNEIDELAIMLQQYYNEEYNCQNDKVIEEMLDRIQTLILKEKIYVLLDKNNVIVSFCTIINPDIGIMFTKKQFRNMGYGKLILSYCSNILRQENDTVYLMTDRDKIESNKVCEKVGFIPFYKYVMTKINCG